MSKKDKPEAELATEEETADEDTAPETGPGPETEPEPEPETESEPRAAAEPEVKAEPRAPAPEPVKRPGSRLGGLALFVAFLALFAVLYSIYLDRGVQLDAEENASSVASLQNRIDTATSAIASLEAAIAELESVDAGVAGQLELLQRDMDERMQLFDSLPPRMANIEQSLSTLQGISAGARNDWLLAEAEHYMQIANAQLQLAANPFLAAQALRMADERVAQLGDPALTDVRRAIADELAALDGMGNPDIEGITLTLASLARVVASLPLREISSDAEDAGAEVDPDLSGVDRAWASVKNAVTGMVRVSRPGDNATPLMTPDAIYFLKTNLTLQLQAARLAVLRGEQAVFEQSLEDAAGWLEDYFDTGTTQVASALETIEEIRGSVVVVQKPDISESLRRLRQFQALNEQAQ
ncbi:MAG TPA: uroporphyrinogen-III C-methyltransferase [Woeseiaceae bacterium]|jgi:uroporphyrin-3 C-methyltransferase|nr:uroporphyrinogen-III C-methyltransferase [Woeseiaceae bacterium]